jgi:hypothetical protein
MTLRKLVLLSLLGSGGVGAAGCSEGSDETPGAGAAGAGAGAGEGAGMSSGGAGAGGDTSGSGRGGGGSAGVGGSAGGGAGVTGGASGRGGAGTSGSGGIGGDGGDGGAGKGGMGDECAPLPARGGMQIEVTPDRADELPAIVREAPSGTTILLAAGTYRMTGSGDAERRLRLEKDGVSLRGATGEPSDVVIDGEYQTEEMISITASGVLIADLTVMRAVHHPIHVTGGPDADVTGVVLHRLRLIDGGEQFVKINTSGATPNTYADDGVVSCSHFELTDAGRPMVVPEPGGCYTGGIDGHQARGWRVTQNTFIGIHCENGSLAEHAVHFWTASRDTLVERNTIIDCARGIGFGMGDGGGNDPDRAYADDPYPGIGYVGHYDGVIRNNVIAISPGFEFFDTGIELEQARGTRVLHNTVIHPETAFASVSHRFANTDVTLENNLVRNIRARDGSSASGDSNLEAASDDLFVDVAGHDLHLVAGASAAIDQGVALPDAGDDIDGEPREAGAPDLGADER